MFDNPAQVHYGDFIGDVLEQETAMDAAVGDLFAGTAWDGKNGLNIRV